MDNHDPASLTFFTLTIFIEFFTRDFYDGPEKVIRHPADGEGDGDGGQQASDSSSTGEHVSGATTADDSAD